MSQNTGNTTAFIEAQQYSQFILQNLHDGLLPDMFTRDVSDFGTGTTLNIKTVGTRTIQDVQEGVAMSFNPIDSSTVTLAITDYIGDAWSVSDELREDGEVVGLGKLGSLADNIGVEIPDAEQHVPAVVGVAD